MPEAGGNQAGGVVKTRQAPASGRRPSGLRVGVARDVPSVMRAWRLVYVVYRRKGLIESNAHRLHTAPQAVGSHAAVIVGSIEDLFVTTITAVADTHGQLPLDRICHSELMQIRREGRSLVEVGLFADRRSELARSAPALFQLMRYAFHFGCSNGTDIVIGVHPRLARFYGRSIGFDPIGPTRTYPAVGNHPVIPMRLDIREALERRPLPSVLDFFVKDPVPAGAFDGRCAFEPDQMAGSDLEAYLKTDPGHADKASSRL